MYIDTDIKITYKNFLNLVHQASIQNVIKQINNKTNNISLICTKKYPNK